MASRGRACGLAEPRAQRRRWLALRGMQLGRDVHPAIHAINRRRLADVPGSTLDATHICCPFPRDVAIEVRARTGLRSGGEDESASGSKSSEEEDDDEEEEEEEEDAEEEEEEESTGAGGH